MPEIDDPTFADFIDRFADRQVVLLGEASHGTSEFYRARAAISRRLIERHGFSIVAVEADWPDAAAVDRHVRDRPRRAGEQRPFQRFPSWMWRNREVQDFTAWLRIHNDGLPPERRCGFFGLDLYNLSGSMAAVLDYLRGVDPDAAAAARERYACLSPWRADPAAYGRAVITGRYEECEDDVVAQLRDILSRQFDYAGQGGDEFLDAAQSARLVASAERYYRLSYQGAAESWNLRDTHMFETLAHLLEARGPGAKAIVWAHNSHIGDARATEMGWARGEHNIGQLCRQRFGAAAALIGLGCHTGTVAAADDWDEPMEIKRVRPGIEGSVERLCHEAGHPRFLLDAANGPDELRTVLDQSRLERFIGVIYRPASERISHYAEARLGRQFDAYLFFDETQAVHALPAPKDAGAPQTWPFGD